MLFSYLAVDGLLKSCLFLEKICYETIELQKVESLVYSLKNEALIIEAYLNMLEEVRRVKKSIAEIIAKPADYTIIEEQGNKWFLMKEWIG